jgi:hypothetical protein
MYIMKHAILFTVVIASAIGYSRRCAADDVAAGNAETAPSFARDIAPLLQSHCVKCHGGKEPEAKLSLEAYRESANVQKDFVLWQKVLKMLVEREMPPDDAPQPTEAQRQAAARAIQAELAKFDCLDQRKRPGRVTIRRLNRAEYNNTIRDLVGVDFKPANNVPSVGLADVLFSLEQYAGRRVVQAGS